MPQTRANKIQTPINGDSFPNFVNDLATMADTANVVIRVASQAERDALTKVAGLCVVRTDLPGNPIQTCDGTNWSTQQTPKVWANSALVGSSSGLLGNLQSGSIVPIFQMGTVVYTPDVNGYSNFAWPSPFPNGILGGPIFTNGDDSVTNAQRILFSVGSATPTLTTCYMRAWDVGANAPYTSLCRMNYFCAGW